MATQYVDDAAAGSQSGADRTNAELLLDTGVDDAGADGLVFVNNTHDESTAGALTVSMSALGTPTRIISVDFTGRADPTDPTSADILAGAHVKTTTGTLSLSGSGYVYGVTFESGIGQSAEYNCNIAPAAGHSISLDTCSLFVSTSDTGGEINLPFATGNNSSRVYCKDCKVKFANAQQKITLRQGRTTWEGGEIPTAGGTQPAKLFSLEHENTSHHEFSGVDFTNNAASVDLITGGGPSNGGTFTIRNSKLPSNWTGSLFTTALTIPNLRGIMINCDDGDLNYRLWVEDYLGVIRDDIVIVRNGGATDGTTQISHKYATVGSPSFVLPFRGWPIEVEVNFDDIGSEITATVHFIHDGANALQNDGFWGEVEHLGTSGFPMSVFVRTDKMADILATPADQDTSTADWDDKVTGWVLNTLTAVGDFITPSTPDGTVMICTAIAGDELTGGSEPDFSGASEGDTIDDDTNVTWRKMRRQKIDVAFTPQEKGVFTITPIMGEPTITNLFLCPLVDTA